MKFVKLTALAAAMAASFGAQAELAAMDEEALEEVTGQAGITIEQDLGATDIWYLDSDGATVSGSASNGAAIKIGIETTAFVTADGSVSTNDAAIRMDIDVVSDTPGSAGQDALRIQQQLTGNAADTQYIHVDNLQIYSTGSAATTGDTAFSAVLADEVAGANASMGDFYISLGATTMYVYGH